MFRHLLSKSTVMALAAFVFVTPLGAQEFTVPSGQPVALQEVFFEEQDDNMLWLRVRFVAPEIGGDNDFEKVTDDFPYLCESYALPLIENEAKDVALVVISLADREIEFGVTDPEVIQFFEAFRPENGTCIWEGF